MENIKKQIFYAFLTIFTFFPSLQGQLIRNYPNTATVNNASYVDDKDNALTASETTFAKVKSYGGILNGALGYSGTLNLNYNTAVPANTNSYTRIKFNGSILDGLLGGGLGNFLTTVINSIVLGNHYFTFNYNNGANTVYSVSSNNFYSSNSKSKIVVDGNGYYYLKSKPTAEFNQVSIEDHTDALLFGDRNNTDVYYSYYNTGSSLCSETRTSFDADGGVLTVDVINLGNTGVTNPKNAIDNSLQTYSGISLGVLAVAGSIKQAFHIDQTAGANKDILLLLQFDNPAVLDLGIADDVIKIQAVKDNVVVAEKALNAELLDLDVLGLLSASKTAFVRIKPNTEFDEFRVVLSSLVNLSLTKSLKIYDVATINTNHVIETNACDALYDLRTAIPNYNAANTYYYYNLDGTAVANPKAVTKDKRYYIKGITAAGYCATEYVEVNVKSAVNCPEICTKPVNGLPFSWAYNTSGNPSAPNESQVEQSFTQPASNYGYVLNIYTLDNSFNMKINGTPLTNQEIQFQSNHTQNIRFKSDGELWGSDGISEIYNITGTDSSPIIRVVISPLGDVSFFGKRTSTSPLEELELIGSHTVNTISWNNNTTNNIVVGQTVDGATTMAGSGYGLNITDCFCYKPGLTTGGATLDTNAGITSLNRAGNDHPDKWPMVRKGGWIALESKTKGFVPNRATFSGGNPVGIDPANFVEGMMVYDVDAKCLKIYTTTDGASYGWKCFTSQTCPE